MRNFIHKLKNIFKKKSALIIEDTQESVVEIEEFFSQKNCDGIIGVNVEPEIQLEVFYSTFKKIKSDKRTSGLFVRICDLEDNCKFSDAIYIIGDWNMKDLKKEIKHLFPDEVYSGFLYEKPKEIIVDNEKDKVFTIWWD